MAGVEYDVTVKAGLSRTQDSTLITVFGTRDATSQTILARSISSNDWWTTKVTGVDVGGIKSALVTMEGKGNWYFEEMEIRRHRGGERPVRFQVNRMMMVPGLPSLMVRPDAAYIFTIFTGSDEEAGTLGTAFVKVFGEFGEFEKHLGTGFRRGVAREVEINAPYFGKIKRLQI